MKKKDLKSGMIVMTNNGFYYLVLLDTGMNLSDITDKDVLLGISATGNVKHKGWMGLSSYNEDMETKDEEYSIFEVLVPNCAASIGEVKTYKSVWRRELIR